jgi:hypothetical protein
MSPILPIGDFLPVDAEGYLINPCRYERIVPPWSDVVAAIKAAYLQPGFSVHGRRWGAARRSPRALIWFALQPIVPKAL